MASRRIGTSGRDNYTAHDACAGVSQTDGTLLEEADVTIVMVLFGVAAAPRVRSTRGL